MHKKPHKWAGQTRKYKFTGKGHPDFPIKGDFKVEDWADRVWGGRSWGVMNGNPTALHYGIRAGLSGIPGDEQVIYGKIGPLACLVHESELS